LKRKEKEGRTKFFLDIEKQAHDFVFDHSVDLLAVSLMYIVSLSLMDDHLEKKNEC